MSPNAQYVLSFDLEPIYNGANYASTTEVLVNGVVEGTYSFGPTAPDVWSTYSLSFDVPISTSQIAFQVSANGTAGGDGWYVGIDDASVVPLSDVPEPGSLALLGVGLVGIGLSRRRERSAIHTYHAFVLIAETIKAGLDSWCLQDRGRRFARACRHLSA